MIIFKKMFIDNNYVLGTGCNLVIHNTASIFVNRFYLSKI